MLLEIILGILVIYLFRRIYISYLNKQNMYLALGYSKDQINELNNYFRNPKDGCYYQTSKHEDLVNALKELKKYY